MPAAPSMGVLAKLGMSASGAATESYEFLNESLTSDREIIRTEGLRGTRLHPAERVRQGRQTPGGQIVMEPTYAELVNLLPRIIGAASGGGAVKTYTVSDTVPVAFQCVIDRVAKVFTYNGCRVNRASFRSGPGRPLEMTMEVEALSEDVGNPGTFPSLTISGTPPFVWHDATLTLGGTVTQVIEAEFTVDWRLKVDRFVNSQTRTDLPSTDLMVTARFTLPWTADQSGLYDAGGGPFTGIAGRIEFSAGIGPASQTVFLRFDFGSLVFPAKKSPAVPGRDELTLTLEGESRKAGSTSPLVVTLDSVL